MTERNAVQRAFDEFGRKAGFEKKGGSWYKVSPDVIAVSNLQKSQYGLRYYFNQAFFVRTLEAGRHPKPSESHIQLRLEGLIPSAEDRIKGLLDFSFEMPEAERIGGLCELLEHQLLPLIQRGSSVTGLRSMLAEGYFKRAAITGPAQQVLSGS